MSPPTVFDYTADHERLYAAIREQTDAPMMQTGFRVLQRLSKVLPEANYKAAVTIGQRGGTTEVIQVEPGSRCETNYGVAIDLGTTTIVAYLIDLATAITIDTEATYNSQLSLGEDYTRRIAYGEQTNAFDQLQELLVHDVNGLIMTMTARRRIDLHDITAVTCAGNTAMIHFLLNLDPTRLSREPCVASAAFVPAIRAAEVGVRINQRGLLYCLPSAAARIGSDVVAGVLTTGIYTREKVSVLIDIGTNGEVVLGHRDWLICTSSSAAPAFEGSGVKCGMPAANGAIESLNITNGGRIQFKTIGNSHPIGICGSGLLDALSQLFANGIVDHAGRLKVTGDPRLTERDDGMQFQLVESQDGHREIAITQADIDNLIRSKASIFAAIRILMDLTQTKLEDIDAVYVAGGFNTSLNVHRAIAIGMLPDVPPAKLQFVGNTSIAGARMVLLSRTALETAERIAASMTSFDLMGSPDYVDEFVKARFLPHADLSLFPSAGKLKGQASGHMQGASVEGETPVPEPLA